MGWIVVHDRNEALAPEVILVLNRFNELLNEKINIFDTECLEQAEIQIKYERYIEKEKEIVERMATLENKLIPTNFDYDKIAAISIEARQKFKKIYFHASYVSL